MAKTSDDTAQPIGAWADAYGHFAEQLRTADALGTVTERMQPALVRLRGGRDPERLAAAREAVLLAFAGGLLRGDAQGMALPQDDAAFSLFWPHPMTPDVESRLGSAIEVLSLGRIVTALPLPAAAPVAPMSAARGAEDPGPAPILAVIDDGIGFLNARFRTGCGSRTRFRAVWLMAYRTMPGGAGLVQAGRVLSQAEIDGWLALGSRLEEAAVYRRLNAALLEPGAHRATELAFSHGTHVLDTAAGAGPGEAAAEWPLLAVQLPPEAVDDTAGTHLEPMILRGLAWILAEAEATGGGAPVIVTIALATFAGPKDGTKAIEALMAQMLDGWRARTGRAARVVLAFGNARRNRQAAQCALGPAARHIDWRLLPDDRTASYVELRVTPAEGLARLRLALTPPGAAAAQHLPPMPPDSSVAIRDAAGREVGRAYHIGPRPTAPGVVSPPHVVLAMAPTVERAGSPVAPHGAWRLALSAAPGPDLHLRAEVQRDDTVAGYRQNGRQSVLEDALADGWDAETAGYGAPEAGSALTRAGTHSSFANAPSDAVLVAAAARASDATPMRYSAEGDARLRPSPSLAALSDRSPACRGLLAAGTLSGTVRASDGTSVAAARTARALAMLYQAGPMPAPGPAETAALIAAFGVAGGDPARLGAGVLTLPAPRK